MPIKSQSNHQAIEELKQASVAQLLFKAARLWNQLAIARIQTDFPQARLSHTSVLPHIDWQGTRITELARRMDVSKQAASQIVKEMAALGMLELKSDPDDGRAKKVFFSQQGIQAMQHGLRVLGELQSELAHEIGQEQMQTLLASLQLLIPVLEKQ